jgi:hypothetical protein
MSFELLGTTNQVNTILTIFNLTDFIKLPIQHLPQIPEFGLGKQCKLKYAHLIQFHHSLQACYFSNKFQFLFLTHDASFL